MGSGKRGLDCYEEWLMQYIPHAKAEEYRRRGWEIHPLLGKHGVWSVLAVKEKVGMVSKIKRWLQKKLFPVSAFPVSAKSGYIPVSGKEMVVNTSGFSHPKFTHVPTTKGPRVRIKRVKTAPLQEEPSKPRRHKNGNGNKKPG